MLRLVGLKLLAIVGYFGIFAAILRAVSLQTTASWAVVFCVWLATVALLVKISKTESPVTKP